MLPPLRAESDGDSSEWPMEQDEAIDSLLCETPTLLPTLSLSLSSGPQAPEGPAVAPAAAAASTTTTAAATAAPVQTTISSHNTGKGIKVRIQRRKLTLLRMFPLNFLLISNLSCVYFSSHRLKRRASSLRLNWSLMKSTSSSIFHPKV